MASDVMPYYEHTGIDKGYIMVTVHLGIATVASDNFIRYPTKKSSD